MIASEARLKSKRLKKQIEGLNNFANERFEEIQQVRRERDEARENCKSIVERANELIARWDQPSWKDTAPTAGFINALRDAVKVYEEKT